jgi:glycosyltransferase involved in cell wall biosynthesis
MTRIGKAPERPKLKAKPTPNITAFMITHIPYVAGYYKHMPEITRASMESMKQGAVDGDLAYDFMVWDNGSCNDWTTYLLHLKDAGYINTLVLTENVGKCEAMKRGFEMIESDLVAYTDDDVLFYDGWLKKQKELLIASGAVLVGGWPVLSLFRHFPHQQDRIRDMLHKEEFPEEYTKSHCTNVGLSLEDYFKVHGRDECLVGEAGGLKFYAHGHHMQFLGHRKDILLSYPEHCEERLMGMMREVNNNIDEAGGLQLTTYPLTCRHMGNNLDKDTMVELAVLEVNV